jgi:hypothetical protein
MRFAIGEIAIVTPAVASMWAHFIGTECEIVGYGDCPEFQYWVRACDGCEYGASDVHLRKKPGQGERPELGEWDLCPWSPYRDKVTSREPVV